MNRRPELDLDALVAGVTGGDRAVLGRAITLVESSHPEHQRRAQDLITALLPRTGQIAKQGEPDILIGIGWKTLERVETHLLRERQTLRAMVALYCRAHHGTGPYVCDACQAVQDYAFARLEHCSFGDGKPTCAQCPVHCYRPEMQERVKAVMAWAGPRMLLYHPILAIRHFLDRLRPSPERP